MKFSIYRIIGNALPPRHSIRNNIRTSEYIVRHEPMFGNCRRFWILNRLTDETEKRRITSMLIANGEQLVDLPFEPQRHYHAFLDATGLPQRVKSSVANDVVQNESPLIQEWILRHKSQALVSVNAARNFALSLGRKSYDWTVVLDGGVMFTESGWREFVEAISEVRSAKFGVIRMHRVYDWKDVSRLLQSRQHVVARERLVADLNEEPQIAFHRSSTEVFDEGLRYGHRNKAELLARLAVPGPWQKWSPSPWEASNPLPAPNKGSFVPAGWVIRLPTDSTAEVTHKLSGESSRFSARFKGVARRSFNVDLLLARSRRSISTEFLTDCIGRKTSATTPSIEALATNMLSAQDRFVTDKAVLPPGGNIHDYYSTAPYWSPDGKYHDGVLQAQPNSDNDPTSGRFDRFSFMQFTSRVYGLAVCGRVLGQKEHFERASELVRLWLINSATRMTATARYAQVIPNTTVINPAGIVEFRQLSLIPYAIKILADEQHISGHDLSALRHWFAEFLQDCHSINLIRNALNQENNIGTWATAVFCSSALFSDSFDRAFALARSSSVRLSKQLGHFSIQTAEVERTRPLHYSLFNLGAWWMVVRLAKEFDIHLNRFCGVRQESLRGAIEFCSVNRERFPDYSERREAFDHWIELLEKMFNWDQPSRDIITVNDVDLGLPPVVFV